MESELTYYKFNKYQTTLTEELKQSLPREVWLAVLESLSSVEFIKRLIAPEEVRGYAKDKPRETKFYNDGRIDVDLTNPHILEDMDFFRERAIFYEKNGKYTNLTPNPNPKSAYAEFWKEEQRRWKYGLVRPSDGEWIPGQLYFYWNYSPIWLVEIVKTESKSTKQKGERLRKFPKPWLGDYLFYHYMQQARDGGLHGKLLKTRGVGFSFKMGAISPCNMYVYPGSGNPNFHLASEKTFLAGDKGIWGKVVDTLDWIAETTPLPRMRTVDRAGSTLEIQLGFKDEYGIRKGLLSSVHGISLKDNPDKARGIRGPLIHYEEDGLFPNLEKAWNVNLKAVEDGNVGFGFMLAGGTGGVEGGSFEGSEKLFYQPEAYEIYGIPNVFDKNATGDRVCGFFWGGYMNRNSCYDENLGEPDVIKALIEIELGRYKIKYNSQDPNAITQKKAEEPITPQEAIMRTEGTVFPVSDLKEYLEEVMVKRESFLAEHYVGELIRGSDNKLKWRPNADKYPLRSYDKDTSNREGCLEIFEMPRENTNGEVPRSRYIFGIDPIDADAGTSLFSIIGLDTFTDRIVCEYTGRPRLAEEAYEIALRVIEFYNGEANYESNLKGLFSYFDKKNSLHRLCDVPQILKDMDYVKGTNLYGNKAHPYNSEVYTPQGFKKWGHIKIGDELFNSYGGITKVIDIPFDADCDVYQISLKDGRKVKASENHLWKVIDWNGYEKILTTSEILKYYYRNKGPYKEYKYYIPKNEGVEYDYQNIRIEPYILGILLGDGSFTNSSKNQVGFTSSLSDLKTYKNFITYEFKTYDDRHHRIVIPDILNKLQELNLHDKKSRTKFIPDVYKFNTRQIRLELLKGLMDTDGTVSNGNPEYCSTSKQLAKDVLWLGRSLGINGNLQIYENKFGKIYKVIFYTDIHIFKLERKYLKQRITKTRSFKTAIINIEKIGFSTCKCVTVDSKDNCYLINEFITTHNSKGTNANVQINKWGRKLHADWMLSKAYSNSEDEVEKLNLHTMRGIAHIEEAIKWNSDGNFDRISAAGMLFIFREDRYKRTQSAIENQDKQISHLSTDNFFTKNYNQSKAIRGGEILYK